MNGSSRSAALFCLWFLAGWVLPEVAAGGDPGFVTRVWVRENGLPQNKVSAVLQTRDGYLWIGTYNGLARFDGVRFVCYDSGNTPELADSVVTSLFEDKDGAIWIGHETGEVTVYTQGHFQPAAMSVRWAKKKILDIGADESGDIWLCNEDGLLARVRDGRILDPESGVETNLVEMTRSRAGTIWVARAGRVSLLQHGEILPLDFTAGGTNTTITAIGASRDGGLWMMVDRRLQKWKQGGWMEDRGVAPSDGLLKLVESREGTLWGTTSDHGLVLVFRDEEVLRFNRANGFCSDWIIALCEDREGNFWAGTGGNGLAMLRESIVQTPAPPDAWQGRAILSVCFDRQNALWVATEGAGLYRAQNETWTNFSVAAGVANPYLWSVAEDVNGNLWAGSWGAGLFVRRGDHFETAPGLDGIVTPMPALFPSRQGGLWIGTTEGLLRYEATGNKTWFARDGISAKRDVRCILESSPGDVWFGTSGEGLFHLQNGALKQFRKADGLPSDFVRCLRADEHGTLWLGTSDGLCRFKDHRFATLNTRQGLYDNVVCDVEDDGRGFFWISSYNGIFRVSQAELQACADGSLGSVHCLAFGTADGLPTLEATSGGCKTADGKLWFPTGRGLVVIDPQDVRTNRLAPPVLIEGLLVDNQPVAELNAPSSLKISPGRHRFEFQYTALSFAAPEKVRFRHRLDDLELDWNKADSQRTAEYPYIPPGIYTFHVIACNNDGVWNETGAALAFTVLPYFWQTAWFHVLGGVLTVLVASAAVWFDTRRRMHRKLELLERQQAVERERTRIAKDIHDDLGASLTRINLLSQTARRDTADPPQTVKSLDQICATARQLTRALDEIVWAVDPQHDTLDSLASYLDKLVHEALGDSGIRCRLDFPMQLPAWPVTAEVRHNLFLAFKEALHNVLKHSAATEVRITFRLEPVAITMTIADNGRGFEPAVLTGPGENGSRSRSRLNGLLNMRKRLEEVGGSCDIQTQPGQGTQVTFFLPLKEMTP
ncbi:MAG TPA: two-component regulator propeller domain-containing protein [Candidatus Acidoferrales bacterium]|nr:two-component regulator propeller domain-containing protein [Candidatus Acidoferrales bacterium]